MALVYTVIELRASMNNTSIEADPRQRQLLNMSLFIAMSVISNNFLLQISSWNDEPRACKENYSKCLKMLYVWRKHGDMKTNLIKRRSLESMESVVKL